MITIKTPGKLMLAGDWSVLEPGNHSIVMPINKYVTVTIEKTTLQTSSFFIQAPDIDCDNIEASWKDAQLKMVTQLSLENQTKFLTVQKALEIVLSYIHEQNQEHPDQKIEPFILTINSEISNVKLPNRTITKPGLGSSAAVTVAIITALLDFHNFDITSTIAKNIIFKLSYLAHIQSQGKMGSGFDIAACTYEKVIAYQRFDPSWLVKKIQTTDSLTELVNIKWPQLTIAPIIIPEDLRVLVGFVGKSAQTKDLISRVQIFKKNKPEKYREITSSIDRIVKDLIEKFTQSYDNNRENNHDIINLINQNRTLLKQLSDYCDNQLETPELTKLITSAQEYGAGAKFSGAGGGDCGIAICFDEITEQNIKKSWEINEIISLDLSIKK